MKNVGFSSILLGKEDSCSGFRVGVEVAKGASTQTLFENNRPNLRSSLSSSGSVRSSTGRVWRTFDFIRWNSGSFTGEVWVQEVRSFLDFSFCFTDVLFLFSPFTIVFSFPTFVGRASSDLGPPAGLVFDTSLIN